MTNETPKKKPVGRPKKTAAETAAEKKAATEREIAIRKNPEVAEQPAPPRRSAANTGAIASTVASVPRSPLADEANKAPVVDENGNAWPSWRYGPDGASGICNSAAEVPKGWKDHPGAFDKAADEPALDL